MKIIIDNNDRTQSPITTIDLKNCHYPYVIRKALETALELDGYTKETIDEVFGREEVDCKAEATD